MTLALKDMSPRSFFGLPESTESRVPTGLREMGRVPADEAWVFTCVSILAYSAAGVPLRVQVRQGREWVDHDDVNDRAAEDLQALLDDVNPEWDGARLQLYIEAADNVHGGSYLRKVRGRLGGPPQELYWLAAPDVRAVRGRSLVEWYEHQPPGSAPVRYPPRDIIPFRRFNLEDPLTIVSPLEAARWDIATLERASSWNARLLDNYGIPPGAWVAKEGTDLSAPEISAIRRALRTIRGTRGPGRVPVLPGGLQWVPLSMSQKDADWIASRKVSRMTVCAVLGVPLVLAGDDEKAAVYASVRDAERIMWRKTLIPKLDARAATLNSWLTVDFDRTRKRLRIAYDYSGIEALQAPPAEEMQAWAQLVDRGLPLNRLIDHFGLGLPVEEGDVSRYRGLTAADLASRVRPEAYQVSTGQGREAVRALGKGLYRHPAVRAYVESGDTSRLSEIVSPDEVPVFAEGLRRRYSADQIADGAEGYKGLAGASAPISVTLKTDVQDEAVRGLTETITAGLDQRTEEMRREMEATRKGLNESLVRAIQEVKDAVMAPRPKVRRIPVRDDRGLIVAVDEVEVR